MVRARIGWGLRGKPAGSHDEYAVLAAGGPAFGKGDYAGIFSRFSPGNPPVGRESPGSLPWVVLSVFRDDHEHYLGLTVQDWSNDTDAAGRPISLSRCFAVPYTLVAENRISYRDLYTALHAVDLPPDGRTLDVELPETAEGAQAALVERFGFERAAAAAALLLEGPVTVTRAEELTPRDRVDFFEAVAALLPCGWRTRFTASTWHNDGSRHLGLVFARQRRSGSVELDWQTPRLPSESVIAGDYWGQLHELKGVRGIPLSVIVAHLAGCGEPLAGAEPSEAVHIFADLDRPRTVLKAAMGGRASAEDLRWVFTSGRFRELRAEERAALFDQLVGLGDVEDIPLVERLWAEAGGDLKSLVRAARTDLRRRDPSEEGSRYLGAAERLGLADPFLAGLVRLLEPGEDPGGEVMVARLVMARSQRDHIATFQAVADNKAVLHQLLCHLAVDSGADLVGWFRQLSRFVPADFLHPFFRVLHGDAERPLDAETLSGFLAHGSASLHALLVAAEVRGRLDRVLPEFASLVITDARLGHAFWTDWIFELDPAGGHDRGMLDVLLLWRDRSPRHLEKAALEDWRGYREGFVAGCAIPGAEAGLDRILAGLAAHLREWNWCKDPRQVAVVLALATAYRESPVLTAAVLAARAAAPELSDDEGYRSWREQALQRHAPLEGQEPVIVLKALPRDAAAENVGRLCAEMLGRGVLPSRLVECLDQSHWRLTGDRLVGLLTGARSFLRASGVSEAGAREKCRILTAAIQRSRSRPHMSDAHLGDLRYTAVQSICTELEHYSFLLETIAADTEDKKSFHVGDQSRQRLIELSAWLKGVIEASRSRKFFGR